MSGPRIAVIGFGEAGGILATDLAAAGCAVAIYDILLDSPATRAAVLSRAASSRVRVALSMADAVRDAALVFGTVTASSAAQVAGQLAPLLQAGQQYIDCNSVAPATRRDCARAVESGAGGYVEAAVMAAFAPLRLATPMLLGGSQAATMAPRLNELGMHTSAVSEQVGVAAGIKLCRSILIKGIEALTVEALFAARQLGVEQQVLASLDRTYPHMGWLDEQPDYLISRVAEHGLRRAAELREVAAMLSSMGRHPCMAPAVAATQQGLVDAMRTAGIDSARQVPFRWRELADRLAASGGTTSAS